MSIGIALVVLILTSFWILGYIYQQYESQVSMENRNIKIKLSKLNSKIEAKKKEKEIYEKNIEELKAQIKEVEDELENMDKLEKLKI